MVGKTHSQSYSKPHYQSHTFLSVCHKRIIRFFDEFLQNKDCLRQWGLTMQFQRWQGIAATHS